MTHTLNAPSALPIRAGQADLRFLSPLYRWPDQSAAVEQAPAAHRLLSPRERGLTRVAPRGPAHEEAAKGAARGRSPSPAGAGPEPQVAIQRLV
jgi:hypothetical protein